MTAQRAEEPVDTRTAILDSAERLVQRRGFNGFSYADIAAELGVTTAALHYHFPTKSELGDALIVRYTARFLQALGAIDHRTDDAAVKLRAYADLYLEVVRDDRMCLCGMLAAEYQTLPDAMRRSVVRFFDDNHSWLAHLLDAGRSAGSLTFTGLAEDAAEMIVGTLEGAMLVARSYGDTARFETMTSRLLAEFAKADARPRRRIRPPRSSSGS